MPGHAARRRNYHHGDLRRALVDAATALLDQHGPLGVTLRGAARAAGVSQAAPYRHFAGKEALLAAVAEAAFHDLRRVCAEAARRSGRSGGLRRLEAVAEAYVGFAVAHPARYRLMWAPAPRARDHPTLGAAARGAGDALSAAIAESASSGEVTGERPLEQLFVFWSLLHGVAGLILDEQLPHEIREAVPVNVIVRSAMRVLFEGFRPRA